MRQPDITILPTNPCSASWLLRANTAEGQHFLSFHKVDNPVHSIKLAELKLLALSTELTLETDWSCHVRTIVE